MPNALLDPPAIYGDAVAGQADLKVRNQIETLIENVNRSNFDLGDLLAKVRAEGYHAKWGFNTFREYTLTLKVKARKAEYLEKISRVMALVNIDRSVYEPLGIARLREITSLDPEKTPTWTNPETGVETPMTEFIVAFVEKGEEITMDDLSASVRTLKGIVGENDLTWLNICLKRTALTNTVRPALEKMKAHIGSVGKDDDGVSQDATDGAALEAMSVEILNDPNFDNIEAVADDVPDDVLDEEVEP